MSTIRVYVQSEHFSDIKLVEVDDHATVADLKRAALTLLPAGTDPTGLSLSIEDDEVDDDEAASKRRIKDLNPDRGVRVHLHRCVHPPMPALSLISSIRHKSSQTHGANIRLCIYIASKSTRDSIRVVYVVFFIAADSVGGACTE